VVALRRQTLQEFPSGAGAAPAPDGAAASPTEGLAQLNELHESGAISDDEFVARAKKLAPT
jgi:hypothetical protein